MSTSNCLPGGDQPGFLTEGPLPVAARRAPGRWLARLLGIEAVVCVVISAALFRPTGTAPLPQALGTRNGELVFAPGTLNPRPPNDWLGAAAVFMLIGGGLLLLALQSSVSGPGAWAERRLGGRTRWGLVIGGVACLFLVAEASGEAWGAGGIAGLPPGAQMTLLAGGIALVIGGLSGGRLGFLPDTPHPKSFPHKWGRTWAWRLFPSPPLAWGKGPGEGGHSPKALLAGKRGAEGGTALILVGITAAALGVRVWALNDALHVFVDELNFATAVRAFWAGGDVGLLAPINRVIAFPRLYAWWQAGGVALIGRNLAGLRCVSALLGTLTVPALYLLARELYGRRAGLIAAGLLAGFMPHVHFSRLGLNNIADPLFGTLALAFCARGMRSGRRADYALAGAALGLTQYFYEGGRLVFPLIMLLWVGTLAVRGHVPRRGLVILGLAALLAAAPVYYTLAARGEPLAARMQGTALNRDYWKMILLSAPGDQTAPDHLRHMADTLLVYVHQREGSFFYAGKTPLVPVALVPLLLLGVFAALSRAEVPGGWLPLLWVGMVSLGNSFLVANTHAARYVVVFPALALLCALGLEAVLRVVAGGTRPRWQAACTVGLVIALGVGQAAYYFGPHLDLFNRQLRAVKPYRDGEDALFRAADFPSGTHIHLISVVVFNQKYADNMLAFLRDDLTVKTLAPEEVTLTYLWSLPRTVDHAFFVEPGDTATVAAIQAAFQVEPPRFTPYDIAPDKQYVLYYAPAVIRQNALTWR